MLRLLGHGKGTPVNRHNHLCLIITDGVFTFCVDIARVPLYSCVYPVMLYDSCCVELRRILSISRGVIEDAVADTKIYLSVEDFN